MYIEAKQREAQTQRSLGTEMLWKIQKFFVVLLLDENKLVSNIPILSLSQTLRRTALFYRCSPMLSL